MTITARTALLGLIAAIGFTFAAGAAAAPPPSAAPAMSATATPATATPATATPVNPKPVARLPLTGMPTLAKIRQSGVLRVGIALNAPFVMHDKEGQPIGYSVDLARRLAASMGWKLKLVETSWPNLMSGLRSNEYDVVISGVSITPQRALWARFSHPVGEFDVDVVANRGKFPSGGIAALGKLAGARIGAREGELTVDYARDAFPGRTVVAVASESTGLADVVSGKLDAYVAEAPLPQVAAAVHPDTLRVLDGAPLARTAHGIAVRVGDHGLLRVINAWIVYERASGWLQARAAYWFQGTGWATQL